jgi:hypothetical protein
MSQLRRRWLALDQVADEEDEIREVNDPAEENEEPVEDGGLVKPWIPIDPPEKKQMRVLITCTIVVLWTLWILLGLIKYFSEGDGFLLVTSSPQILLIRHILRYYFAGG